MIILVDRRIIAQQNKLVRVAPVAEGRNRVAAQLLADRPELARLVITHRFPLDAVSEAFAAARDRASGAIKVVLEP